MHYRSTFNFEINKSMWPKRYINSRSLQGIVRAQPALTCSAISRAQPALTCSVISRAQPALTCSVISIFNFEHVPVDGAFTNKELKITKSWVHIILWESWCNNLGQNTWGRFQVLTQFPFNTSETELDYYHKKAITWILLRVAKKVTFWKLRTYKRTLQILGIGGELPAGRPKGKLWQLMNCKFEELYYPLKFCKFWQKLYCHQQ